jgi:outer membrane murein-binding lipoprotein Lpp
LDKIQISLSSRAVELAEYKNYLELLNRVCYYSAPNANGTELPYDETTLDKAKTLENMPVYAKYTVDKDGNPTFTGHEARKGLDGEIVFGTVPIGVHTEVFIKDDTVELPDKTTATLPCLFAKQKVWKRNKNAMAAVKRLYEENNLHNSWEISTEEYTYKNGVKYLLTYVFDGNCFLGLEKPAYGNAASVISLSATNSELLVAEALSKDLLEASENPEGSEETNMNDEEVKDNLENQTATEKQEEPESQQERSEEMSSSADIQDNSNPTSSEVEKKEPETASLTDGDINRLIYAAVQEYLREWPSGIWIFPMDNKIWVQRYGQPQTSVIVFSYAVEDNSVVLGDPQEGNLVVSLGEINATLSARDETIVTLNSKIQTLESEVSSLAPYKTAAEQAERERAEAAKQQQIAELRQYAEDANVFTKEELDSDEITTLISDLKSVELKAKIADRIVAKQAKPRKPETASAKPQPKPKADINISDTQTPGKVLMDWLNK